MITELPDLLMKNNISGVILAGGSNRRFGGRTKANASVGGTTIISRIIKEIRDIFPEIIIVTNKAEEFREYAHYRIVPDQYPGIGPLGGIHAALKTASKDAIFVFACDMPFTDRIIIAEQIDEFRKRKSDVLLPKIGRYIEPLHAIYRVSVLDDLERFIAAGKSKAVKDFIAGVNTSYFVLPDNIRNRTAFANINSPSDLSEIGS